MVSVILKSYMPKPLATNGEVGQRIEIEATMTFCMGFDGFYGTTYINTFVDANGNIFVYRGNPLAKKGEKISLKATVKEHGEYKGDANSCKPPKTCKLGAA